MRRLQNPEFMLGSQKGIVILDEIQEMPELFKVSRVLMDRPQNRFRFLVLGSASPDIVKKVSETLAGRVEFIELSGFDLQEVQVDLLEKLWLRGGFPRSFLTKTDKDSMIWREGFIRTFLNHDIPQLGISIPTAAIRRFWTMLAHYHGQTWNASELGRSMGLSASGPSLCLPFLEKALKKFKDQKHASGFFMVWSLIAFLIGNEFEDFSPLDRWIKILEEAIEILPDQGKGVQAATSMLGALIGRQPWHPQIEEWAERTFSFAEGGPNIMAQIDALTIVVIYRAYMRDFKKALPAIEWLKPEKPCLEGIQGKLLLMLTWPSNWLPISAIGSSYFFVN